MEYLKNMKRGDLFICSGVLVTALVIGITYWLHGSYVLHHKWALGIYVVISIAYFIFSHIIQVFPEKYEISILGACFQLGGFFLGAGVYIYLSRVALAFKYEGTTHFVVAGVAGLIYFIGYVIVDLLGKRRDVKGWFVVLITALVLSYTYTEIGLYVVGRETDSVATEITDKEITISSRGRRGRRRQRTHYYVEVEWQGTQRFSVPAQYYNAVEIGDVVEIGIGESLFGIKYLNLQE